VIEDLRSDHQLIRAGLLDEIAQIRRHHLGSTDCLDTMCCEDKNTRNEGSASLSDLQRREAGRRFILQCGSG
jgi:hypothetical protein